MGPQRTLLIFFHISQFIIKGRQPLYTSSSLWSLLSLHQELFMVSILTLVAAMCVQCYPYFIVVK